METPSTIRKKVLFLITKATYGGAQRYVYDLATNLPKEEFEPVVAYGTKGRLAEDLSAQGIQTYQLPSLGRDIAILSDIKSFFEILSLFRNVRPDVVHLNSSKAAALGAVAARLTGVPKIIFTVHGWPFGENRNILVKLVLWSISWLTAIFSHVVVCVSEYDLNLAKQMPFVSRKAIRIYNGIAPISFGTGEKIRNAFPAGVKITGTIGELTSNKNQIGLIEKARQQPNMYAAIVGEGENRATLEQKVAQYGLQDRVKFFGFLPAAEALKGFDVFALPSLKEGLPYVLLEAKQADIPIDANRVGGVDEILSAKDMSEFSLEQMLHKTILLY